MVAAISVYEFSSESYAGTADAAIVLGAAVWRDGPSPVFEERISHAIDLYAAGRVRYLIFTGGVGRNDDLSEAEVGRREAIAAGVPENAIIVDSTSEVTCENLVNARILASELGIATYLVVSDPLHMRRAVTLATDEGMDAYPSPTPTTRYISWRSKLPFLARESYFLLSHMLSNLLSMPGGGC
jgi:uncharacterized SAM-binding protein YcdF (DUF218 family)